MIWPPSVMRVRLVKAGRKRCSLWLPLILIWPIVLALGIALSPIVAIVALALWPTGAGRPILLLGPRLFVLFCRLRGLRVEIEKKDESVVIRLM